MTRKVYTLRSGRRIRVDRIQRADNKGGIRLVEKMAREKGFTEDEITEIRAILGKPKRNRKAPVTDEQIVAAVRSGAKTAAEIADRVGLSESAARARAKKLAEAGKIKMKKRKTYDTVCNRWAFGGAVSCQRVRIFFEP